MKKYLLTVQIPIEAFDDPAARQEAEKKLKSEGFLKESKVKLQEIFQNEKPRKVEYK
jgi:hypothetical protein